MANNITKDGMPRMNTAVRSRPRLWMFRDMNDFLYNSLSVNTLPKAIIN